MAAVDAGFPRAPAELTTEWLTDRLRADGVLNGAARVTSAAWEPLGETEGMAGAIVRVRLGYAAAADNSTELAPPPPTLIAKFATTQEQNLAVMLRYGLYAREVHFYRALAPGVPARTPRCHAAEVSADGRACVLVLEDLGAWEVGDQVAGCDASAARTCVIALARLHGAMRADEQRLAGVWRADGQQAEAKIASFPVSWERARSHVGDRMAPELVAAMPRYIAALPALHEWAAAGARTLVHGDMRLDNVLFGPGGDLALVDWQNCQRANGLIDVAYFLTQSVPTETRRQAERDLLGAYAQALGDYGTTPDPEALWQDYRMAALCAFSTAIVLAGLAGSSARNEALAHAVIARAGAAVADLELLGLLEIVTRGASATA